MEGWREDERTLLRVVVSFSFVPDDLFFFSILVLTYLLAKTTVTCLCKK